ncbi:hypothetical protein QC764_0044300 [Podospora pseudoanserina]|uniref:Uncharacterized protein n=1 Tax=Podospora pseudoanserina TaxID=2609844 RepID=A0ABR0IJM4_9PEZI|nr:hypothetical protein QC764_0044300 [Podospora pseudoanserina]
MSLAAKVNVNKTPPSFSPVYHIADISISPTILYAAAQESTVEPTPLVAGVRFLLDFSPLDSAAAASSRLSLAAPPSRCKLVCTSLHHRPQTPRAIGWALEAAPAHQAPRAIPAAPGQQQSSASHPACVRGPLPAREESKKARCAHHIATSPLDPPPKPLELGIGFELRGPTLYKLASRRPPPIPPPSSIFFPSPRIPPPSPADTSRRLHIACSNPSLFDFQVLFIDANCPAAERIPVRLAPINNSRPSRCAATHFFSFDRPPATRPHRFCAPVLLLCSHSLILMILDCDC